VLTAIIIIFAFVVKVDLTEGSLHLAAIFPKETENALCEKQREPNYITIQTIQ